MKTKSIIIATLSLFVLISFRSSGQESYRTVTGMVTSFQKIPLNNVRVYANKSGEVERTDSTGKFSIKCLKKDFITVSASGFLEKRQKIGKESAYKINLSYEDNVNNFNDAVSHGHITPDVLRNAIFTMNTDNGKDYSKYKTIYDLIASEIYNVRVNGNTILNTKVRSFDKTPEVLIVVDDKVVHDISYINPDYVKAVEFIDDVGTTMYGSMGANGVLKITLK
jgi:hypothetical protein